MAIIVLQNEEISERGKNGGRKEVGFAICQKMANWGAQTSRKENEEELFSETLTPT